MMHIETVTQLRTQLREVNIEYSVLVRTKGGEDRFVRLDELKARRRALMALIAETPRHPPSKAFRVQAASSAAVRAA
jgi:hypothetical protein